ncbi:hypothetical protein TNCV_1792871 [Trichonephila clavipes]|nr:hypothetical protein TNCV_1792871 [Trichonephila clavipes]
MDQTPYIILTNNSIRNYISGAPGWAGFGLDFDNDVVCKLITGRREELKTGLVALKTKLGWTLMDKVPRDITTDKRDTSMNIVTILSQEDIPVSTLWDLEMLGIRDTIEQKFKREGKGMSHSETVRQRKMADTRAIRLGKWIGPSNRQL